jgi:hypothetical protein
MTKTREVKVAEQLVNLTEDHWFNPAILARHLTDQPFYTVDRIMELVAQIIRWESNRHNDELTTDTGIYNSGQTSEGLFLANELNETLTRLIKEYKWENLKLPVDPDRVVAKLPKVAEQNYRHSWLHDTDTRQHVTIDHPFI